MGVHETIGTHEKLAGPLARGPTNVIGEPGAANERFHTTAALCPMLTQWNNVMENLQQFGASPFSHLDISAKSVSPAYRLLCLDVASASAKIATSPDSSSEMLETLSSSCSASARNSSSGSPHDRPSDKSVDSASHAGGCNPWSHGRRRNVMASCKSSSGWRAT